MISFGEIPAILQTANLRVCEYVENYLNTRSADALVDTAGGDAINQWAATLQIDRSGKTDEMLKAEIIARLNANGSVGKNWFYLLAERIGFLPVKSAAAYFEPDRADVFGISWNAAGRNRIHITDGKFLPFRSGISRSRDIVYGNNTHGATSVCVIYESFGDKRDEQMKNLLLLARNLGTVINFYGNGVLE